MKDQQLATETRGGRGFAFRVIAIALPIVALLMVELGFRVLAGTPTEHRINITPFSIFTRATVDGVQMYRISHRYAYNERNTVFPVRKPDGGIRIFLLGGSASASWPHPAPETFGDYLQQALQFAFPERSVEVINAAAHGFAAYRVRSIFDEIIAFDPDAVVIYSGNNEFLENREYDTAGQGVVDAVAENSRLVQWLLSRFRPAKTELAGDELKDVAEFFWKKVKREALELRKDPERFDRVKAHYAESIDYMAEKAGRRRVPVLLFTVPVNLRDWLPTVSYNRLGGERLQEWTRLGDLARRHLLQGDPAAGIPLLEQAIALEPEHAESYFWLGRLYEAAGRDPEALESYRRAKDLDYNPFRAHSAFNESVRRIAAERPGAFLLDLESIFEREADRPAPGFDLFLDYAHPTKRGNLIIAEKAFDLILKDKVVAYQPSDTTFTSGAVTDPNGKQYDEAQDVSLQRRKFNLYAMNHQYAAAESQALFLHGLRTGGPPAEDCEALSADLPASVHEGCRAFHLHLATRRSQILGEPVDPAPAAESLQTFFEKWYPYGTF